MALSNGLELTGLHHVSAITANAEINRDFYARALGMRLVKKTVNQDALDMYHLYYADGTGSAGTDLTFFDYAGTARANYLRVPRNQAGSGEIQEIALRITGDDAFDFWKARFDKFGIPYGSITRRGGHKALPFTDPEGQRLALIDDSDAVIPGGEPWELSPVSGEFGIKGLGAITTSTARPEATLPVLTDFLGYRIVSDTPDPIIAGNRTVVLETGKGGVGSLLIVRVTPSDQRARPGAGGVHHVAFRVTTFEGHEQWNQYLTEAGFQVTPVIDRFYFKAMYFREPGGVLYEISTDEPGFATDEPAETLGESLALPTFLEPQRAQIEAAILPLDTRREILTAEYAAPSEEVVTK